jgi:hypothetical protein
MKTVYEQGRDIPVKGSFDVVVMGGGPAGVSAAVAAAKTGVNVALIERYGYLGGQATGGLVIKLCGLTHARRRIIKGFCQQIIHEMKKLDAAKGSADVTIDPETLKYVLDKAIVDNKVKTYLHSLITSVKHNHNSIEYVFIENKSGRQAIQGKIFVDATGDGDSARWCNLKYRQSDKHETLPVTLIFRVTGVKPRKARQYFKDNPEKLLETIDFDENIKFVFKGWTDTTNKSEAWFDALFLKNIDGTDVDDLTQAEIISRRYIHRALEEIKKIPGFEKSHLRDTASQLGVRETRRIVGRYTLTRKDINRTFEDSIARARIFSSNKYISIPYRCLTPKDMNNLLFAGRCISVSSDVFNSIREIPCCMATGEAAGVASALCVLKNRYPSNIDVKFIQDELIKRDALI